MFFFSKKAAHATLSMDQAAQQLAADPSILLLDVRTPGEYRTGHIPGSVNLPLDRLTQIAQVAPSPDARLFVYCQSGGRSRAACTQLVKLGYTDVTNLGGISAWTGRTEKGA